MKIKFVNDNMEVIIYTNFKCLLLFYLFLITFLKFQ